MGDFNPYTQNVTFLAGDQETPISVPMGAVDQYFFYCVSTCLNYGVQLGAAIIMLFVLLVMTPSNKFRRPSSVLHLAALLICVVRMCLLSVAFTSHFNDFYAVWAYDYSKVPQVDFNVSVTATTFSLVLLIAVEAALMHQAWTMVKLWPTGWKVVVSVLSALISLYTIAWRIAFTVVQNEATVNLVPPREHRWVAQWTLVSNTISICWFCLIFNSKLIHHLVSNRGVLPSYRTMTPMEVLIITNGILMIVPAIFSGLEWAHFTRFESASLTLTSVAIILPLGTLAAQRIAHSTNLSGQSGVSSGSSRFGTNPTAAAGVLVATKSSSVATGMTGQSSILSRCEAGGNGGRGGDHHHRRDSYGLELDKLSEDDEHGSQVRINRHLTQHEERV